MNKGLAFWTEHIAAIKREAISTSAYAKRHGIPVKRLYYWQRKAMLASAPVRPSRSETFVALRIAEPMIAQVAVSCTLILESGMRLEMSALPAPTWLAALGRAAQGTR